MYLFYLLTRNSHCFVVYSLQEKHKQRKVFGQLLVCRLCVRPAALLHAAHIFASTWVVQMSQIRSFDLNPLPELGYRHYMAACNWDRRTHAGNPSCDHLFHFPTLLLVECTSSRFDLFQLVGMDSRKLLQCSTKLSLFCNTSLCCFCRCSARIEGKAALLDNAKQKRFTCFFVQLLYHLRADELSVPRHKVSGAIMSLRYGSCGLNEFRNLSRLSNCLFGLGYFVGKHHTNRNYGQDGTKDTKVRRAAAHRQT